MGMLLLSSCGQDGRSEAATSLAFDEEANARRYLSSAMVETDTPEATVPLWTEPNPTAICVSPGWVDSTETVFTTFGMDASSASMTSTGRGCRAALSSDAQQIEVGVEVVAADAIDEVATARQGSPDDEPLDLMGLVELDLDISDTRVASSLFNSELDRLEEHRWVVVDDSAFHVLVVVEPGGAEIRDSLLDSMSKLEDDLAVVVSDNLIPQTATTSADDPVVDAVAHVIRSVMEGSPLDDAATPAGLEAIAPENTFPENMAAIAAYRDAVICSVETMSAECSIEALESVYRFVFVQEDLKWLLDDFWVDE